MTALGISRGPTLAPVETRGAGDYTDQILAGSFAAATGRIQAASVAGVQAAAGIVGRSLASAVVEGDGGAVDAHLLEGIGTDLVRAGRFLGRLTVGPRDGCVFSVRAPRRVSPTEIQTRSRGSTGYKKAGHPRRAPCAPRQAKLSTSESTAIHVDRGKASRHSPVRSPAASSPHGSPRAWAMRRMLS